MRKLILIGVLVVVIVLAAWWFWPVVSRSCEDVQYWDTAYGRRWRAEPMVSYPFVGRDDRDANAHGKWKAQYINLDGDGRGWAYPTLQELEDAIDGWPNMRAEDLADLHRIIDCIQAGCPSCENVG
jgi:hypothetical protein